VEKSFLFEMPRSRSIGSRSAESRSAATSRSSSVEVTPIAASNSKRQAALSLQVAVLARARAGDTIRYQFLVTDSDDTPTNTPDPDLWVGEVVEVRFWEDDTFRSADIVWNDEMSETSTDPPEGRCTFPQYPDLEKGCDFHIVDFSLKKPKGNRLVFNTYESARGASTETKNPKRPRDTDRTISSRYAPTTATPLTAPHTETQNLVPAPGKAWSEADIISLATATATSMAKNLVPYLAQGQSKDEGFVDTGRMMSLARKHLVKVAPGIWCPEIPDPSVASLYPQLWAKADCTDLNATLNGYEVSAESLFASYARRYAITDMGQTCLQQAKQAFKDWLAAVHGREVTASEWKCAFALTSILVTQLAVAKGGVRIIQDVEAALGACRTSQEWDFLKLLGSIKQKEDSKNRAGAGAWKNQQTATSQQPQSNHQPQQNLFRSGNRPFRR
jgi:hypothetical protein